MDPDPQEQAPLGSPQSPAPDPQGEGILHPRPPTPRSAEPQRRRLSNLTLRLLTAAMLIPPVIWVCYTGGLAFVVVIILFNLAGIHEFYSLISQKGAVPHRMLGTVAAVALPLVVYLGDAFVATSFMTMVLLTVMVLQLTKTELRESIASVSATFFGVFYVAWLLSHGVSVRFISSDLSRRYNITVDSEIGFFYMLLCLVAAVLCDAGAYFVGRRYGKHKLAPDISPNKSVEGALGGIVVGAIGAVLTKVVFDLFIPGQLSRDFSFLAAAMFGVVIASVAMLGDLVESVLKRDADLKDAGRILPGVGGVLDRIDSALLALPVMYYMLLAYYYVRFMA